MSKFPVLFIGGPADGKRLEMEMLYPTYHYPHGLPHSRTGYRLERLYVNFAQHYFYVLDSMTPEMFVQTLVDGYRGAAKLCLGDEESPQTVWMDTADWERLQQAEREQLQNQLTILKRNCMAWQKLSIKYRAALRAIGREAYNATAPKLAQEEP